MSEENIQNRDEVLTTLQLRNSTASQYESAAEKIPLAGEAVVYLPDDTQPTYTKIKIGDGTTKLSELKFIGDDLRDLIDHDESETQEQLGILLDWKDDVDDDVSSIAGLKVSVTANSAKLETLSNFKNGDYEGISGLTSLVTATKATVDTLSSIGGDVAGVMSEVTKTNAKVETLANHVIGDYTTVLSLSEDELPTDESTLYYNKTTEVYYYYNSETQAFNYVSSFPQIPVLDTTKVYYVNGTAFYWYYKSTEGSETGTWTSTKKPYEAGLSGTVASIQQTADDNSAKLSALAEWKDGTGQNSLAGNISEATADFAKSSQIAQIVDADGTITRASIIAAVNNKGESTATITADQIDLQGVATFMKGDNGILNDTITDTKIEYARANSSENFEEATSKTEWSTTPPEWVAGEYMWQRIGYKKGNDEDFTYTTPVCIQGAAGTNIVPKLIKETKQFAVSSSDKTFIPRTDIDDNDIWRDTPQLTDTYKHVWTRSLQEWDTNDDNVADHTATTEPYFDRTYSTLSEWCSVEDVTKIDGAKIFTGSITAEQLHTDAITSQNYWEWGDADNEWFPSGFGMRLNLKDGTIHSKNFQLSSNGTITATGANISGIITATTGKIGGWNINSTNIGQTSTQDGSEYWVFMSSNLYSEQYNVPGGQPWNPVFGVRKTNKDKTQEWPFYVRGNGALKATTGNIAGWEFDSDGLYKSASANGAKMEVWFKSPTNIDNGKPGTGAAGADVLVLSVTDNKGTTTWPFILRASGFLEATNVNIKGTIDATSGKIGAWTLTSNAFKYYGSTSTNYDNKTYYLDSFGIQATGVWALSVGPLCDADWGRGNFRVSTEGYTFVKPYKASRNLFIEPAGDQLSPDCVTCFDNKGMLIVSGSRTSKSDPYTSTKVFARIYKDTFTDTTDNVEKSKLVITAQNRGELKGGQWYCQSGNSMIVISDYNKKKDIDTFDKEYDKLFDNLIPRKYRMIDGESNRYHTGFIAQEVMDATLCSGLTSKDFAAVCRWETVEDGEEYGLRYDEFVALNTWQIQKLKAKNSELENRINILEAELASLKR